MGCSSVSTPIPTVGIMLPTAIVSVSTETESSTVPATSSVIETLVPTSALMVESDYSWRTEITATCFWGGELPSEENQYISNEPFAWTGNQVKAFGGVDTPDNRDPLNPYHPAGFTPLENPFYVALPAAEYDENGLIFMARESSHWWKESVPEGQSLFKNRWVEVRQGEISCYGQWEDVGPGNDRQYDYVFGNARTENEFGLQAGIDLSPAMAICLGADSEHTSSWSGTVSWRFVDQENVPDGPWLEIVTTSGPKW